MQGHTMMLAGIEETSDFIRWAILALLFLMVFYLLTREKKKNHKNLGKPAMMIAILLTPFIIVKLVPNKEPKPIAKEDTPITIPSTNISDDKKDPGSTERPWISNDGQTDQQSTEKTPSTYIPIEIVEANTEDNQNDQNDQNSQNNEAGQGSQENQGNEENQGGQGSNQGNEDPGNGGNTGEDPGNGGEDPGNGGEDPGNGGTDPDDPPQPPVKTPRTINTAATVSKTSEGEEIYAGDMITVETEVVEGYHFKNWESTFADLNGITENPYTFEMPDQDIEVNPVFEINTYSITLNSNGGTEYDAITKNYNAAIGELPSPEKEDSVFLGWFMNIEEEGETKEKKVTENLVITGDITIFAKWTALVCKVAETLHQQTCSTGAGCVSNGYSVGNIITFGQKPAVGEPERNYAYDCDINNDGTYNPDTERFYLISKSDDKAKLVFYSSFEGTNGINNSNNFIYSDGIKKLPTTEQWTNPNLETFASDGVDYAARFVPYEDLATCGNHYKECEFIYENSGYVSTDTSLYRTGIWLESSDTSYRRLHTKNRTINSYSDGSSKNMIRPTITISLDLIERKKPKYWSVEFESNGGTEIATQSILDETTIDLPTPTKENHKFFGWYSDAELYNEVAGSPIVESDMKLYARWIEDTEDFPIVFSQINACTFNGSNANVTGGEGCDRFNGKTYVESGIQLYTQGNYNKDFEVGLTIVEYATANQNQSQATLVNSKLESNNYPGFVVRRASDNFEISETMSKNSPTRPTSPSAATKRVRIIRQGGYIYYAWNDEEPVLLHNLNTLAPQYFDTTVTFGAGMKSDGLTPQRELKGKITDMYVKLAKKANGETSFESSDEIKTHNVVSQAAQNYLSNAVAWSVDKDTLLTNLKDNYDTNGCKPADKLDISSDFESAYRYTSSEKTYCDRPTPYETGLTNINVYLSDENTKEKGALATYVTTTNGNISNMIPGVTYYFEDANDSTKYGFVKAEGDRRLLSIGSIRNARDLGGLEVDVDNDGQVDGTIKYGRLVRGTELTNSETNKAALEAIGINTEYELREDAPANDQKLDNYVSNPVRHYDFNTDMTTNYDYTRTALKNIMQDIVDNNETNIYFHCTHGADRTGTIAYLLEGLLGVSKEDRYEDYELTSLAGQADRTRFYDHKVSSSTIFNPNRKFVFMTSFVEENSDIYTWFMAGSDNTAEDEALITNFRNAMIDRY